MKASTKLSEILSLMAMPVTDHPGHFEIESRQKPGTTHRVRLRTTNSPYFCECGDFLFNCEPKLANGADPFQGSTMCCHIAAALFQEQVRRLTLRKP